MSAVETPNLWVESATGGSDAQCGVEHQHRPTDGIQNMFQVRLRFSKACFNIILSLCLAVCFRQPLLQFHDSSLQPSVHSSSLRADPLSSLSSQRETEFTGSRIYDHKTLTEVGISPSCNRKRGLPRINSPSRLSIPGATLQNSCLPE